MTHSFGGLILFQKLLDFFNEEQIYWHDRHFVLSNLIKLHVKPL